MEELAITQAPSWAYWVAGAVIVLVPAGLALGKAYFWAREKFNQVRAKERAQMRKEVEETEKGALDAANEALGQLSSQVAAQGRELAGVKDDLKQSSQAVELERKGRTNCEAEYANMRAMLKLVALWAKKRGMPTTPEIDELITQTATGPHKPLPAAENKP